MDILIQYLVVVVYTPSGTYKHAKERMYIQYISIRYAYIYIYTYTMIYAQLCTQTPILTLNSEARSNGQGMHFVHNEVH